MRLLVRFIVVLLEIGSLVACLASPQQPAVQTVVVTATGNANAPRPAATRAAETRAAESAPTVAAAMSTVAPTPTTGSAKINPFGILISLNSPERQTMVKSLGVTYFRPDQAIIVENWDGTCTQCDIALRLGLKLILTLRANGGGPQNPSSAPKDMAAYQKTVGDILDKYRPEVLVIENEENSANFYTSTPEQYGSELKAACQVAHSQGIKCANGGLVHNDVALLVWDSMFEGGQAAPTCDFAQRALDAEQARQVCGIQTLDQLPAHIKNTLSKDKAFLQVYKSSGADYMNFHWYIADANALGQAAAFLQSVVGLPLMTNEMGQQDDNPATVTNLLNEALALKLPYVIWFSIDPSQKDAADPNKSLHPTALNNLDGTLRPTGAAFHTFIQTH